MRCKLRKFLWEKYGGFSNKRHKNADKNYSISIDDFDDNDNKNYVTSVQINVIDDIHLELCFCNNLESNFPFTENLYSFLENYEVIDDRKACILIKFDRNNYNLLNTLISEFSSYYSKSPNYAWVGPRITKSLKKLLSLLQEYEKI